MTNTHVQVEVGYNYKTVTYTTETTKIKRVLVFKKNHESWIEIGAYWINPENE